MKKGILIFFIMILDCQCFSQGINGLIDCKCGDTLYSLNFNNDTVFGQAQIIDLNSKSILSSYMFNNKDVPFDTSSMFIIAYDKTIRWENGIQKIIRPELFLDTCVMMKYYFSLSIKDGNYYEFYDKKCTRMIKFIKFKEIDDQGSEIFKSIVDSAIYFNKSGSKERILHYLYKNFIRIGFLEIEYYQNGNLKRVTNNNSDVEYVLFFNKNNKLKGQLCSTFKPNFISDTYKFFKNKYKKRFMKFLGDTDKKHHVIIIE